MAHMYVKHISVEPTPSGIPNPGPVGGIISHPIREISISNYILWVSTTPADLSKFGLQSNYSLIAISGVIISGHNLQFILSKFQ